MIFSRSKTSKWQLILFQIFSKLQILNFIVYAVFFFSETVTFFKAIYKNQAQSFFMLHYDSTGCKLQSWRSPLRRQNHISSKRTAALMKPFQASCMSHDKTQLSVKLHINYLWGLSPFLQPKKLWNLKLISISPKPSSRRSAWVHLWPEL